MGIGRDLIGSFGAVVPQWAQVPQTSQMVFEDSLIPGQNSTSRAIRS